MSACAVQFPAMAKESPESDKEQLGQRIDKSLMSRLRAYANAHPMQPTLTRLLEMAVSEWLANHEHEASVDRHAKDKGGKR